MDHQDAQDVPVDEAGIRLGQFLKLAGIAESGAHARTLLAEGEVSVAGEVEQRRGRQLAHGDVVVVSLPDGEHAFRVA
ncbi:RNA-binding S4 domain-containing protein [Actinotalea ferrariae]|uniref:RNA-binding S4 domain-containing protein n=1 Tax=Actinotalea ferrariae TaxID=1386098 RepID=UPI0027E1565A|nr:RNA-binding S4 domain-containing protein [Actinotalea ferrariae]